MWIVWVFSSVAFLTSIILSIPLAFDVGGRTCGLAFSFSLATFYFQYSTLKLLTPEASRFRWALVKIIGFAQWIIIPSLMIWSLNRFSVEATAGNAGWVERTFGGKRAQDTTVYDWILGRDGLVESATIGGWDKLLRWSTPFFQLCEGFCSLLVIQAAGQITRWTVNRSSRNDTWMVSDAQVPVLNDVLTKSGRSSSLSFLHQSSQAPFISSGESLLFQRSAMSTPYSSAWQ